MAAPTRYLDMSQVGSELGVSSKLVCKWLTRYQGTDTPCPTADVVVGDTPGWAPDRIPEWRAWRLTLPGRGRGGGRPPVARARRELALAEQEVIAERPRLADDDRRWRLVLPRAAAAYCVDSDTASALWVQIAEANLEMPNQEVDALTLANIIQSHATPSRTASTAPSRKPAGSQS